MDELLESLMQQCLTFNVTSMLLHKEIDERTLHIVPSMVLVTTNTSLSMISYDRYLLFTGSEFVRYHGMHIVLLKCCIRLLQKNLLICL